MTKTTGSSGMGYLGRPGQTERSTGGVASDVKKPLLIALLAGPVVGCGCGLLYLVLWLVWKRTAQESARRFFECWQEVLVAVPLVLWAIAFFVLFITWLTETWNKHWPPAYGPADPGDGLLGPLWGIARSLQSLRAPRDQADTQHRELFADDDALRAYIEDVIGED